METFLIGRLVSADAVTTIEREVRWAGSDRRRGDLGRLDFSQSDSPRRPADVAYPGGIT